MRRPGEFTDWAGRHPGFGPYAAVVRNVVDGDTIDCLIDVGFNSYLYSTIRLAGIDAPEKNRAVSKDAGVAAKVYLEQQLPLGTRVVLHTKPDPDSFGRYIAYVVRASDEADVNTLMTASGHAKVRHDYD